MLATRCSLPTRDLRRYLQWLPSFGCSGAALRNIRVRTFIRYTGQRLRDIARFPWQKIDTERQELRFITLKTGRRLVPLASALIEHLRTMQAGDNPAEPLFPSAYEIAARVGGAGQLSQQFYAILVAAGSRIHSEGCPLTTRIGANFRGKLGGAFAHCSVSGIFERFVIRVD